MVVLTKLLLAHFLGDFVCQRGKWVAKKESDKLKSPHFYFHILIHAVLVQVLIGSVAVTVVLTLTHAAIDASKIVFQKKHNGRLWFFFDQFLHFLVIALLVLWQGDVQTTLLVPVLEENLVLITAWIILTKPTAIMLLVIFSTWRSVTYDGSDRSLKRAGMHIGMIERTMVYVFMILGYWLPIGLVLLAKAAYRWGDLKGSTNERLRNYILLGTLLSFGTAIVVSIAAMMITS